MEYTLEFGKYDAENQSREVTVNGENIGWVSMKDVPYLTSRSIDEIFYSRIIDTIRKKYGHKSYDLIHTNYYITIGGYLAKG